MSMHQNNVEKAVNYHAGPIYSNIENTLKLIEHDLAFPGTLGSTVRCQTPCLQAAPRRHVAEQIFSEASEKVTSKIELSPTNKHRKIRLGAQKRHFQPKACATRVKDLQLKAKACERSKDWRQAAQNYHMMGVTYDNSGKFVEAIEAYKKAIHCADKINDSVSKCLAYNCIGINYQKLNDNQNALAYYTKHANEGDDTGKYVAHCNLGLLYQKWNLHEHAVEHHQKAIMYAQKLRSKPGEYVSMGNLGASLYQQILAKNNTGKSGTADDSVDADRAKARMCIQYALSGLGDKKVDKGFLVPKVIQDKAIGDARQILGNANIYENNYEDASEEFMVAMEKAQTVVEQTGLQDSSEKAICAVGCANGMKEYPGHVERLVREASEKMMELDEQFHDTHHQNSNLMETLQSTFGGEIDENGALKI